MSEGHHEEAPILALLRIGLGALWVYDGLVFKVLAVGLHLASARAWPAVGLSPEVQARVAGGLEVAFGLLLLSGILARTAAALLTVLLALLSVDAAQAMPIAVLRPLGLVSRNLVLGFATLTVALVPRRSPVARQERLLALILRVALGLMWLYEGVVLGWLIAPPGAIQLLARGDAVPPEQAEAFLRALGVVEAFLGLVVLAGFRVRQFAVLQVCLLGALAVFIGWASPAELLAAPGGLSRHLALIGCALILYETGGGALALDDWLVRNRTSRRWQLLMTLQGAWLLKVGTIELYRLQASAADRHVSGLLQKIEHDDAHHAQDLRSLLQRHGGSPLPLAGAVKGLAWLLGGLIVIAGMRIGLEADLRAKERALSLYQRAAQLLPAEEGLTARALQAMQDREASHHRLLRESLDARRRRR